MQEEGATVAAISGGVSCNPRLCDRAKEEAERHGIELRLPVPSHSTDNAAMIAYAAACRRAAGIPASGLNSDIDPNLKLA